MVLILLLTLSISSLSGHPTTSSNQPSGSALNHLPSTVTASCYALSTFADSLEEARSYGSLCVDSMPKTECTTASLEILKKCLDGDGIHVDRVCLEEVHSKLTEVSMDNHDCFCGGLVKFSDMLTSVEALLCPDENQGRVGTQFVNYNGNGADVFYGNYGYPYASPLPGQRCAGRNFNNRRCCTPENPCGEGEGDCDGPGDGGSNDGHRGCRGGLVCGSNNCLKFGLYYHEKDDCCEQPRSLQASLQSTSEPYYSLSQWGSWSSCSISHQQVIGRCRKIRTRWCQGQGCRSSQDLQEWYCQDSSCTLNNNGGGGYGGYRG